jgi:hypothetical protein
MDSYGRVLSLGSGSGILGVRPVQECVVSEYGGRSSMAERFSVEEDVEGSSPFGHPK